MAAVERNSRRTDNPVRSRTTIEHLFSQKRATDNDVHRSYGFTRVRARSKGVCGSPRLAATDKFAAVKLAAVTAPGVLTSREAKVSLVEPRSSILEDQPPCSTSPTLLIGLPRSWNHRTPSPDRRTTLAANWTLSNAVRAADSRRDSRHSDERLRPSPAFEQVTDHRTAAASIIATSNRTRRPQRVLYEEGNARQCDAAGRKPHRDH